MLFGHGRASLGIPWVGAAGALPEGGGGGGVGGGAPRSSMADFIPDLGGLYPLRGRRSTDERPSLDLGGTGGPEGTAEEKAAAHSDPAHNPGAADAQGGDRNPNVWNFGRLSDVFNRSVERSTIPTLSVPPVEDHRLHASYVGGGEVPPPPTTARSSCLPSSSMRRQPFPPPSFPPFPPPLGTHRAT